MITGRGVQDRPQRFHRAALLARAVEYAGIAAVWMRGGSADEHDDRQAYLRARYAARLAFRAAPGLRGDQ